MNIDVLFFIVVALVAFNMYHGNKYTKLLFQYRRQWRILCFVGGALLVYIMFKKNPERARNMLLSYMGRNDWARMVPVQRNTFEKFGTMFDLTQHPQLGGGVLNESHGGNLDAQFIAHTATMNQLQSTAASSAEKRHKKRVVSETKKKYVASNQNWKCGKCGEQLKHTFEVDHRVRLDQGGTNDVANLVALCRECHGFKTSMENM